MKLGRRKQRRTHEPCGQTVPIYSTDDKGEPHFYPHSPCDSPTVEISALIPPDPPRRGKRRKPSHE